jgi:hypothetical protein
VSSVKGYRDECLNVARVERKAAFVIRDVGWEVNEQLCYLEAALPANTVFSRTGD